MHLHYILKYERYFLSLPQNCRGMKYSIAFKDLPFEPENRQVIYVENQHDERINAIIKENYDWLKFSLKMSNLDFVYLPMFFNDEETREKVLYYAPYLTTEIIEKTELRSSYLLSFMSRQENRKKIQPSFIYAPQKVDEEWIFSGMTIDVETDDVNTTRHFFSTIISEIEEKLEPVIRFSLHDEDSDRRYSEDLDDEVPTTDKPQESSQVEYSSTENIWEKIKKGIKNITADIYAEEGPSPESSKESSASSLDEIREEDVRETIEDLERDIERLRLLGIPLAVLVEYVAKYETISRLRLTDDNRIFLPDYGNREVLMEPLYKAVFFLFLNHPEGIVLKRLEECHHELVNYYLRTSHRKELTPGMIATINNLEYPGNDNINVVLSKIKKCFKQTVDEHLAKHYYIVGKPGEPYKISLDYSLIEWEDEK